MIHFILFVVGRANSGNSSLAGRPHLGTKGSPGALPEHQTVDRKLCFYFYDAFAAPQSAPSVLEPGILATQCFLSDRMQLSSGAVHSALARNGYGTDETSRLLICIFSPGGSCSRIRSRRRWRSPWLRFCSVGQSWFLSRAPSTVCVCAALSSNIYVAQYL